MKPECAHVYECPVSRQDAHARVGHHVQSERVESLEESQRSVQADLLPAFAQHDVDTLQNDARVLVRCACQPKTLISAQTQKKQQKHSAFSRLRQIFSQSEHGSMPRRGGEVTCVQRQQGFVQVGVEFQRVDIEHVACRR